MSEFRDVELTEEELKEVTAGTINNGTDKVLDKLDKSKLEQIRRTIEVERELSFEELTNVKAGIPKEMVEETIEENSNLFRKH